MATYDPEEQENIDELKTWWSVYGTQVIVVIAVFIASIAGVQAWNYYQQQQTDQAVELYDSLLQVQGERGCQENQRCGWSGNGGVCQ